MVGEINQNVLLIQIDALSYAEFEISEFEVSIFDCNSFHEIKSIAKMQISFCNSGILRIGFTIGLLSF